MERQLKLGTLVISPGAYAGPGWRSPEAEPERMLDLSFYRDLARLAERGGFDFLFFPDMYTVRGDDDEILGRNINIWPEPLTLFSALAGVTDWIGLSVTMSTTYHEPFHVARMIASLDHLSGGRASWNMVTSRGDTEAHNFRNDHRPAEADRHEHAQEFFEVVTGLWDSWEDGAILADRESGQFADPAKIHRLRHNGKWLSVYGPLNVSRPPQGHPVIIQAGASERFRESAARNADVVFTALPEIGAARAFREDIRRRMPAHGRSPEDLLVMPGLTIVTAPTEEAVARKLAGRASNAPAAHCTFIGTPGQVADGMEEWLRTGAVDGFIYIPHLLPAGLRDFVDLIIPELRRRGIFRDDYTGTTLREHLGLPRPANRFAVS